MSRPLSEAERGLAAGHMHLAESYARKFAWMSSYDELLSVGFEALCMAARNYAPAAHGGTPFSAYARLYVAGSIKRFGHRDQSIVPTPRKYRKLRYASYREQFEAQLERELGRAPNDADMAKAHGLSVSEYALACAAGAQRDADQMDVLEARTTGPEWGLSDTLEAALKVLSPRDETILRRIYGFGCEPVRQEEIAIEVGVATPIVYRLHMRALATLRELLAKA